MFLQWESDLEKYKEQEAKLTVCPVFICSACADPEEGTGGPDPPWNSKILPKKGNFGIFWGLDPPPRL